MQLFCCHSLPVWRRHSWRLEPFVTYLGQALDTHLERYDRKTTTLLRDLEYFIPSKLNENQSSDSEDKVENVKRLRRTDDDEADGRRAMKIGHSSCRLRWAKNSKTYLKLMFVLTYLWRSASHFECGWWRFVYKCVFREQYIIECKVYLTTCTYIML